MREIVCLNWDVDLTINAENCLFKKTMISIQDMFENGKPDIVLKTVKGFNIKNSFYNFDSRKLV